MQFKCGRWTSPSPPTSRSTSRRTNRNPGANPARSSPPIHPPPRCTNHISTSNCPMTSISTLNNSPLLLHSTTTRLQSGLPNTRRRKKSTMPSLFTTNTRKPTPTTVKYPLFRTHRQEERVGLVQKNNKELRTPAVRCLIDPPRVGIFKWVTFFREKSIHRRILQHFKVGSLRKENLTPGSSHLRPQQNQIEYERSLERDGWYAKCNHQVPQRYLKQLSINHWGSFFRSIWGNYGEVQF